MVSLILRLLSGEYYLAFLAAIPWPWYDAENNLQHFPFRTLSMLIGLGLILGVSYLFKWLLENGRLDAKYDVWNAVVNKRNNNSLKNIQMATKSMDVLDNSESYVGEDNPMWIVVTRLNFLPCRENNTFLAVTMRRGSDHPNRIVLLT